MQRRVAILAVLAFALAACAGAEGGRAPYTLSATQIEADPHCRLRDSGPEAMWIGHAGKWAAVYPRVIRHAPERELPPIDFTRSGVLLVGMGQQPTAGYAVALASSEVEVAGSKAIVRVRWTPPPPGAVTAQVITSPCLLVELPRGAYGEILVEDVLGRRIAELKLSGA